MKAPQGVCPNVSPNVSPMGLLVDVTLDPDSGACGNSPSRPSPPPSPATAAASYHNSSSQDTQEHSYPQKQQQTQPKTPLSASGVMSGCRAKPIVLPSRASILVSDQDCDQLLVLADILVTSPSAHSVHAQTLPNPRQYRESHSYATNPYYATLSGSAATSTASNSMMSMSMQTKSSNELPFVGCRATHHSSNLRAPHPPAHPSSSSNKNNNSTSNNNNMKNMTKSTRPTSNLRHQILLTASNTNNTSNLNCTNGSIQSVNQKLSASELNDIFLPDEKIPVAESISVTSASSGSTGRTYTNSSHTNSNSNHGCYSPTHQLSPSSSSTTAPPSNIINHKNVIVKANNISPVSRFGRLLTPLVPTRTKSKSNKPSDVTFSSKATVHEKDESIEIKDAKPQSPAPSKISSFFSKVLQRTSITPPTRTNSATFNDPSPISRKNTITKTNDQSILKKASSIKGASKDIDVKSKALSRPATINNSKPSNTSVTTPPPHYDIPKSETTLEDFELGKELGKGGYGIVQFGLYNPLCDPPISSLTVQRGLIPGKKVAIKILNKARIVAKKQEKHVMNEISILESVRHSGVIQLYDTFQDTEHLYLVTEFVEGADLFTILSRFKYLPEDMARFWLAEIVLVIEYLHDHAIIYRDIKPENILINMSGHIKLIDFGFAKSICSRDGTTRSFCGTPAYMSPEILSQRPYSFPTDWWSFGILIHELLTGYTPFLANSNYELCERIIKGEISRWSSKLTPVVKDLISGLLDMNPGTRLGGKDVRSHPWFDDLDWRAVRIGRMPVPPLCLLKGDMKEECTMHVDEGTLSMKRNEGGTVKRSKAMDSYVLSEGEHQLFCGV